MSSTNVKYGFMYLHRFDVTSPYRINSVTEVLYDNMIQCVDSAVRHPVDTVDHPDCKMKIAYFKIMTNSEIIKELHAVRSSELATRM